MKNKYLFVMSCLFFILFSSAVFGFEGAKKEGPYIAGRIGMCFLDDSTLSEEGFPSIETEFDTGLGFEVALGTDLGMYRFEVEVGYRKNDVDTFSLFGYSFTGGGDFDTWSFMANGYLDFENQTAFTPYIGAGIGYATVSANDISFEGIAVGDYDDSVFAYQVGAGVGYSISESLIIDLAYKYFATDDPDFEGTEAEYSSHNISIGLRYSF